MGDGGTGAGDAGGEALLDRCELCPWRCGVNRQAGERGFCGAGTAAEVYRHGPHLGEEPPISGSRGSGTVFFSRCTLRCLYCQNFPWSQAGTARSESLDADGLAGVFASLARQGCHNWNLVSPTPWLPVIEAALARAKSDGAALPVVYNTSGFERVETLRRFAGLTDVYLTDLRYARDDSAREGSGAAGYVQTARRALAEMARQTGPLRLDADGLAVRGTVCRILILPGRADEAVESLGWLAESAGDAVAVSVMSQYLPAWRAPGRPGWDRRIRREEYERVREAVEAIGFLHGWIQEFGGEAPTELVGYEMKPGGSDGRAETGA